VVVVFVVGIVATALVACGGGTSVAGTYKYESGDEASMKDFTLTLNDDDTFKLAGPNPMDGEDVSISGSYTVDGDKISLKGEEGSDESEVGTVDGDKLVFETITWVKQ
jgi:hypothetical protein